jgi:GGDEF domain-containing protein
MIIVVLIAIIAVLILFNWKIHKEINSLKNINQKIKGLNVLQDFMSTVGENISVEEKIKKINNILIEEYDIKYSTIVEFDGTEYVIKASNVEEKHWDNLRSLQNEEIFKDSISTAIPKYITVNDENERLPYQKSEFGRAKSAMFFPLYIDNVYIGYWIIESGFPHAFDDIDTTILEVVKDNILSVFNAVNYQNIIESMPRDDLYSSLKTGEYLYNDARKLIDKHSISTICMFRIANIEEINEKISRNAGNNVITLMCEYIKKNLSPDYIFVRYMGPKFVIAFSGVDVEPVSKFLIDLKKNVEKQKIIDEKTGVRIKVKLNFVLSRYYKGTALEQLLKKLEEYLDNTEHDESDINII